MVRTVTGCATIHVLLFVINHQFFILLFFSDHPTKSLNWAMGNHQYHLVFLAFFIGHAAAQTYYCPPLWAQYGSNCYRFFGTPQPWQTAEKDCKSFHYCHLASIHSKAENDFVFGLWKAYLTEQVWNFVIIEPSNSLWVGLNDITKEGVFEWSDQTPLDYTYWQPGEPNDNNYAEDCTHLWTAGDGKGDDWNDAQCSIALPYVCKLPAEYEG